MAAEIGVPQHIHHDTEREALNDEDSVQMAGPAGNICQKKVTLKLTWLLLGGVLAVGIVGVSFGIVIVRLSQEQALIKVQRSQLEQEARFHEHVNDVRDAGMVSIHRKTVHYELKDPYMYKSDPGKENKYPGKENIAEYLMGGFREVRHSGNSTIHLKDHKIFIVQQNGTYTIIAKMAFVGYYRNAAVGIYIDDLLCDKGLTSAPLSPGSGDKYRNILVVEPKCLDIEIKKGQKITLRSFHHRAIYQSNQTSWVHIENH